MTGVFVGMTLIKFMGTIFDWEEAENQNINTNSLKNALLSHALLTVYPNRTSMKYYLYNGKYLPPLFETILKGPDCAYFYMKDIRRQGVYKFIERYLYTEERQREFFNLYWKVVNEAESQKQLPEEVHE